MSILNPAITVFLADIGQTTKQPLSNLSPKNLEIKASLRAEA